MKKHLLTVCCFLMIGAAVLFGTPPAWTQDSPPADSDPTSNTPSDSTDEQPASEDESALPDEDTESAEDLSLPTGEPVSGGKSIVPSDEMDFEPGEVEMEETPAGESVPVPGEVGLEESPGSGESVRYTVRQGDTLWDITQSVWNDPFLWPKVWKNNAYIFNPDLIYPGNVLEFPKDLAEPAMRPETALAEPPPPMQETPMEEAPPAMEDVPAFEEEAPPPSETVEEAPMAPPVEPKEKEPDFASLASNGFILYGHEARGTVVGGVDNRDLFGKHDLIYIRPDGDHPVSEGDRMILSRKVRKVYHPQTKAYLGELIHVLGVAEITEAKQDIKTARVLESFDYISRDDSAIPYQSLESNVTSTQDVPYEGGSEGRGFILDVKEDHLTNALPDVVYLDRGMKDGLEKGNRFDVIRTGSPLSKKEKLPWRRIGQVEILMALDITSTARVIHSTEAIQKGDRYEPTP